ncbi:MAG: hypothetical protein HUJ51_07045 [Eggerthellaceae bacterium]|nr:hypothetical protein [Eggerthellaceae bacterium]
MEGEVGVVPGLWWTTLIARRKSLGLLGSVATDHIVNMKDINMFTIINQAKLKAKRFGITETLVSSLNHTDKTFMINLKKDRQA